MANEIERLTEEERWRIEDLMFEATRFDKPAVLKALRIIDAQASALAEARDERNAWEKEALELRQAWDETRAECERLRVQEQNAGKLAVHHLERAMTAESRAEALQARTAELEAELKAERDRRVEHRQMNQSLNEQVQRLEAKCYKAAAALMDAHAATDAAESELADLRGRVERTKEALVSAPVSLDGRIARALEALRGR